MTAEPLRPLLFWGKARPSPGAENLWHPVVWHGLDVAAVGTVLLRHKPWLTSRLATMLGWDEQQVGPRIGVFLALHDVGKLTWPFQAKVCERWPSAVLGLRPVDPPGDPGHGAAGMRLLMTLQDRGRLGFFDDWIASETSSLLDPFLGHHGRPIADACSSMTVTGAALFGKKDVVLDVAAEMIALVSEQLGAELPLPLPTRLEPATWPLAGLAALADWIGSRQQWFPYASPYIVPETYWREHALPRAAQAVEEAGIVSARSRSRAGFSDLVGDGRAPSPLQAWAEWVELPAGPALVIVEDVTGSARPRRR